MSIFSILVSLWFILNFMEFSIFVTYYFQVFFNLKVLLSMVKITQNTVTEVLSPTFHLRIFLTSLRTKFEQQFRTLLKNSLRQLQQPQSFTKIHRRENNTDSIKLLRISSSVPTRVRSIKPDINKLTGLKQL